MKHPFRIASTCCALLLTTAMAQAAPATYYGTLTGAAEATPNGSPGLGSAIVVFDLDANTLQLNVAFNGLEGLTSAAHIHCCTTAPGTGLAGVATETPTFGGFPLGVSNGLYAQSYDTRLAATWNPAFLAAAGGTPSAAAAAFGAGLASGSAYLNLHTNLYPAGEIRAFLQPVPEPGQWAMLLLGIPAVLAMRRRPS